MKTEADILSYIELLEARIDLQETFKKRYEGPISDGVHDIHNTEIERLSELIKILKWTLE